MSEMNLPGHWEVVRLEEVCALRAESVQPTENPHLYYVGLEHINPGNPHLTRWGLASEVSSSKSRFYAGDVLYGKLRPYLDKSVLAEFDGICSTDILVFKSSELVDSQFLVYLTHTKEFLDYAVKTTRGVNHPRTSWSSIATFEFYLPSLPEQRAIAHALQTIQEARAARQREIELERERKAALMDYLFSHGTRDEPRKQTEIGEIPESWEVGELGKVASVQGGYAFKSRDYTSDGVPLLKISNVSFGEVIWEDISFLPKEYILKHGDYLLKSGDLVMAMTRPIVSQGIKVARLSDKDVPCLLNQRVCRFNPKGSVNMGYLFQLLFNKEFVVSISDGALGSQQPNISAKKIEAITIPLPSVSEQSEITEILDACDTKIAALEREAALLEELFRAMLDELMTGKRAVTPLIEKGSFYNSQYPT